MSSNVIKIEGINPYTSFISNIDSGIGWGIERYISFAEKEGKEDKDKIFKEFISDLVNVFNEYDNAYGLYTRFIEFVNKYKRKSKENNTVISTLKAEANIYKAFGDTLNYNEAISIIKDRLESLTISDGEETNKVNVIKIGNREIIERKYNYIIGLAAKDFVNMGSQSPVLSDNELKNYVCGDIILGENKQAEKEENLINTLKTADKDAKIILGYNTYDSVEFYNNSPSIFYMNMLAKYGKDDEIKLYDYKIAVDSNINVNKEKIWDRFKNNEDGKVWIPFKFEEPEDGIKVSASKINNLLRCSLRYYYECVLGIKAPEYMEKKSQWLEAKEKGTLFHSIFEKYCKKVFVGKENISSEFNDKIFYEVFDNSVNEMIDSKPYVSENMFSMQCAEIKESAKECLIKLHKDLTDNGWKVQDCEVKFKEAAYEIERDGKSLKLLFNGIVDRIDEKIDDDGKKHIRIIDYKTGKYEKKKVDNNVQHIIYAVSQEKNAIVDEVIYDFVEKHKEVPLNDDKIRKIDSEKEDMIFNTIVNKKYEEGNCEYCPYKSICKYKIGDKL